MIRVPRSHYALCRRRHNAYNAVLSNIRFAKRGTAKSRWFDSRIAFKNAFSYVAILGEPSNRRTASPQRILRIKKPDDLRRFLHFLCCLRLLHNFNSIGFPDVPAIQPIVSLRLLVATHCQSELLVRPVVVAEDFKFQFIRPDVDWLAHIGRLTLHSLRSLESYNVQAQ